MFPIIPQRPPPKDDGGESCKRSASVAKSTFCCGCDADVSDGAMHSNNEAEKIVVDE